MNSYKQSLYSAIIRVMANLVMVGAIFLAMRQASRQVVWPSEAVFCLYFFGITIPAWIIAWQLTKWVRRNWPAEPVTMVDLPKRGPQLVKWSIGEKPRITPDKVIS